MMRSTVWWILPTLLVLVAPAWADAQSDAVDGIFARWAGKTSPGMTVAVLRDGKPLYARGYGMANIEFSVPNGVEVVYPLASNSKQFMAFAVYLLEQDGRLALTDDVRKYIPELHNFGTTITLDMLVHHTSGLREIVSLRDMQGFAPEDVPSRKGALELLYRQRALNFAPGTGHNYCNSNYLLLAEVVERVSGMGLGEFWQSRIFTPLGMSHTSPSADPMPVTAQRASGYGRSGNGPWLPRNTPDTLLGPTGINSTVGDLAKWLANYENARIGGAAVIAAMLQPGSLSDGTPITYAGGLHREHYRGLPFFEHSGHNWGYTTDIITFPQQHLSIIILANTEDAAPAELVFRVADIYLKDAFVAPPAKPTAMAITPQIAERYTGTFEVAAGTTLRATGRRYVFARENFMGEKAELAAASDTEFFAREGDFRVRFEPVPGGGPAQRASIAWSNSGDFFAARRVPDVPPAGPAPAASLFAALQGDYWSEELGVAYRVTLRDGRLWMRYPRGDFELRPALGGVFQWRAERDNIAFTPEGFSLTSQNQRIRDLRFVRLAPTKG